MLPSLRTVHIRVYLQVDNAEMSACDAIVETVLRATSLLYHLPGSRVCFHTPLEGHPWPRDSLVRPPPNKATATVVNRLGSIERHNTVCRPESHASCSDSVPSFDGPPSFTAEFVRVHVCHKERRLICSRIDGDLGLPNKH